MAPIFALEQHSDEGPKLPNSFRYTGKRNPAEAGLFEHVDDYLSVGVNEVLKDRHEQRIIRSQVYLDSHFMIAVASGGWPPFPFRCDIDSK